MRNKFRTLLAISLIIIITIIFHYLGWLRPLENIIYRLLGVTSANIYSVSVKINDEQEKFDSTEELHQAYINLKNNYLDLQAENAVNKLLVEENKELRDSLNFFSSNKYFHVGAEVVGKNFDTLGRTIIINIGAKNGVNVGDPVIVGAGVLVGVVSEVYEDLATVRLINDNQSEIAAAGLNTDRSQGLVEGGFGISVQMNFIPQNESINVGDTIVTTGLIKQIPRGLLIGTVEAVEREAYQPFQKAILTPFFNLDKISRVSVLILE